MFKNQKVSSKNNQIPVDLCFTKPRLVDFASCILSRYDGGINAHTLERTGVLVCEKNNTSKMDG